MKNICFIQIEENIGFIWIEEKMVEIDVVCRRLPETWWLVTWVANFSKCFHSKKRRWGGEWLWLTIKWYLLFDNDLLLTLILWKRLRMRRRTAILYSHFDWNVTVISIASHHNLYKSHDDLLMLRKQKQLSNLKTSYLMETFNQFTRRRQHWYHQTSMNRPHLIAKLARQLLWVIITFPKERRQKTFL